MKKRRLFKVHGSQSIFRQKIFRKELKKNVDNEEIRSDIPDYVNLYKISSYGRILSLAKQGLMEDF